VARRTAGSGLTSYLKAPNMSSALDTEIEFWARRNQMDEIATFHIRKEEKGPFS
jgi:hypothetical protein